MPRHETLPRESQRARGISAFRVMDLLARARQLEADGRNVLHMEVGEPDFPTPPCIVEAAARAVQAGHTRYTPALGLPELRERIARDYYARRFGLDVGGRVAVTSGASGALQLALAALIDPGDEVLLTDPGYPCNAQFVRLLGGRVVELPVRAAERFQPRVDALEAAITDATRVLLLASPANPTGTIVEAERLDQLIARCRERGVAVIVDEIYHALVYDRPVETVLSRADDVIVINSFSKYFQMTGFRLGWLVAPPQLMDALDRLAQNLFLSPPTIAQHAAMVAFDEETSTLLEQRRQTLGRRRDRLVAGLRDLGLSVPVVPDGAFYVYAGCASVTSDSHRFAYELLESQALAITPGIDFGSFGANEHLRFAYTTDLEGIDEALERLRAHLARAS